ncbi:hypothetical protein C0993_003006 [Termitomyces sp. T159_Od127]|nr:hypothetical protein C0993_003006 [Termitomyces sp. T159_Od127]
METAAAQVWALEVQVEAMAARIVSLEEDARGPRGLQYTPRINAPEVYDGKSKALADQFVRQVEAAAEFERFRDNRQKILWAQSYLSGSAQDWSCIITTGDVDPEFSPRRFQWTAWLTDFKAAFCTCDPAQDALAHIGLLQQGFRSIMDYCTAFFGLRGKLGHADAESEYMKDRFWKGLNAAAMEALVNTDFVMAEKVWDILLRCESKLADIVAKRKGQWQGKASRGPVQPTTTTTTSGAPARMAPPPASQDPDAMDMDHASCTSTRKCFKCGKTGHFMVECLVWMAMLKAVVREAVWTGGSQGVEESQVEEPKQGFV